MQSVSLQELAPTQPSGGSFQPPKPEPSVLIGIFPAAAVHIRTEGDYDERLALAYEQAVQLAEEQSKQKTEMAAVQEEDEDEETIVTNHVGAIQNGKRRSIAGRRSRPKSLVIGAYTDQSQVEQAKEQPPLPSLTAGDSTIAGSSLPLIDEISCAIREWYGVSANMDFADIETSHLSRESRVSSLRHGDPAYRCFAPRPTSITISKSLRRRIDTG